MLLFCFLMTNSVRFSVIGGFHHFNLIDCTLRHALHHTFMIFKIDLANVRCWTPFCFIVRHDNHSSSSQNSYTHKLHVWYIYLHDMGDFIRANVGIYMPAPWFASGYSFTPTFPRHWIIIAGDGAPLPGFGQQRVVLCTFGSEWWSTARPARRGSLPWGISEIPQGKRGFKMYYPEVV